MSPLLIETALAANAALALALFMFIKWRKTMTDAESVVATMQRQADFVNQASALATQLVAQIAAFQTAVSDAVQAIQSATGTVPQAILDAAAAINAQGTETQNILNALQDGVTKLGDGTNALNGASAPK